MAVFICYRRDDTEGEARALHARLAEETDERHLFLDHDAIGAGDNWHVQIDEALRDVKAALIVIGPRWLGSLDVRADRGEQDVVRRRHLRPDLLPADQGIPSGPRFARKRGRGYSADYSAHQRAVALMCMIAWHTKNM